MYEAAVLALRHRLEIDAVVVSPTALKSNTRLTYFRAAHPIPQALSRQAATTVLAKLQGVDERTIVLFLISGGASSMIEQPVDATISVADTARFYQGLLDSGLSIIEMNTIRKHFSAVKGGRLTCAATRAAAICTLIVSDVPAGSLDSVGSGPSMPDSSSRLDCRKALQSIMGKMDLPKSVMSFFDGPLFVETPKPNNSFFRRHYYTNILSSNDLEVAASRSAHLAGFHVVHDNTCDEWDYREAGTYLLERARQLRKNHPNLCLISVGELSVPIEGPCGDGGRNQHFALWCAIELARKHESMAVLSAGSDGIDGRSSAAGAVANASTCRRARQLRLDAKQFLDKYDSASLFATLGDTIVTGPTGINLRDLRLIMSLPRY